MDILAIPFHHYLGLTLAEPPGLVELFVRPEHCNHLGTVHASVMIAVAEAGSGLFLVRHASHLQLNVVPIIRRMEAKFHQAGMDRVVAQCALEPSALVPFMEKLQQKGRSRITVPMQVVDSQGVLLLTVSFEWFVQQGTSTSAATAER